MRFAKWRTSRLSDAFDFDLAFDFDREGHGFQPRRKAPQKMEPGFSHRGKPLPAKRGCHSESG